MKDQNRFRRISIVLFILFLITLAVHMESLVRFNRQALDIHGDDSSRGILMEIDARKDSTSTWLKRSFRIDDTREVDLTGQTIDGTLQNQTGDAIQDWELRINITGDCYINQAWTGDVEIHQYAGTEKEKVQRLNLQNYQLDEVTFEYRYDGDLLIPLQAGDYVIYYPNARSSEMPIEGGSEVRFGVIFYYLDSLDLSDYDLRCHLHRNFTQGITFYPMAALLALWLMTMVVSVISAITYRRARKELELRKSGIFSMSDIYDLIYIIHLPTGEMTPVSVDEAVERNRPKNISAKEQLSRMVQSDAEEKYREMMLRFVDTDTLAERLKDRDSVVSEFVSREYGWCSLRFFAMGREEGKPLENVVLAVQNINEEKKELEAITAHIEKAETDSRSQAAFMDRIARDLKPPLEELLGKIGRIQQESADAGVQEAAREAHSSGIRLLALADGLMDSSKMQKGENSPTTEAYSLRNLLRTTLRDILPMAAEARASVTLDIAENLPDQLQGDPRLLQEVLLNLFSGVLSVSGEGRMTLSLYGKALGETIHLLFSIRTLQSDENRDQNKITGLPGLSMDVVSGLLAGMGSELHAALSPAGRMEYYFETEQLILDPAPIGKISAEDFSA